jgi:hypothetical protein
MDIVNGVVVFFVTEAFDTKSNGFFGRTKIETSTFLVFDNISDAQKAPSVADKNSLLLTLSISFMSFSPSIDYNFMLCRDCY